VKAPAHALAAAPTTAAAPAPAPASAPEREREGELSPAVVAVVEALEQVSQQLQRGIASPSLPAALRAFGRDDAARGGSSRGGGAAPGGAAGRAAVADVAAAVTAAMRVHAGEEYVQVNGCVALLSLSSLGTHAVQAGLGAAGSWDVVQAALRAHVGSALVQQAGWAAVMNLCQGVGGVGFAQNAHKDKFVAAGAYAMLVGALRRHVGNAKVAVSGCGAVAGLCLDAAGNSRAKLGALGACGAVAAAMQRHAVGGPGGAEGEGAGEEVAMRGCDALGRLCGVQATCAADENRAKAGGAGACETVVAAIRAYPRSALVQEYGLLAVANLIGNNSQHGFANSARLHAAGVCPLLQAALRSHGGNAAVAESVCRAATNLVCVNDRGCDANLDRLGAAGACVGVVTAMRAHPRSVEVQTNGCGALLNMSQGNTDASKQRVTDAGGCEAVLTALRLHPRNAQVQNVGSMTLTVLREYRGNSQKLRNIS
jgi:hypothetical protein